MRSRHIAAAVLAATLSAPAAAGAASLSMNPVDLPPGADLEWCKAMGRAAIAKAELRALPEAEISVFGTGPNGILASFMCLPDRGVAVVAIAGDTSSETGPLLRRILGYLGH